MLLCKLSQHWITDRVSHSLASPCWSSLAANQAWIDQILTTSYIMIQLRPCYQFIFHQSIGVTLTVSLPILFDLIYRWDPGHEHINDNGMFVWQFRLTGNGKGHVTCSWCWPSPWSFCLLKTQFQHTSRVDNTLISYNNVFVFLDCMSVHQIAMIID